MGALDQSVYGRDKEIGGSGLLSPFVRCQLPKEVYGPNSFESHHRVERVEAHYVRGGALFQNDDMMEDGNRSSGFSFGRAVSSFGGYEEDTRGMFVFHSIEPVVEIFLKSFVLEI